MYEALTHSFRHFLGHGALRAWLAVSMALTLLALAAWSSGAFRAAYERWRASGGWRATLAGFGTELFKALLLLLLLRLAVVGMLYQADCFSLQYGRVTEKNRSMVLMKWGAPHEQREISVRHTRKRVWVTRQLKSQAEKGGIVKESFWKDQEPPIQAIDGRLPILVNVSEEVKDVDVPQNSLASADIDVELRSNPRRLGNANYAGYDDAWSFKYLVKNLSQENTVAHMSFALPAETGLFDGLYLRVDGAGFLSHAKSEDESLKWEVPMAPGAECVVETGYRSRGLEHLRYIPARMSPTAHYRITMKIDGIPAERLDYPVGSMPPLEKLDALRGSSYSLNWQLDNALTSYDVGVKLPQAEQPRCYYSRLLNEAPLGLVLLLGVFSISRLILGAPLRVWTAASIGAAYFLLYTFMGHLADVLDGFLWPFAISAATMTLLVAWIRLKSSEDRLLNVQDAAAFAIFAILYPLAVADAERTAFWMQFIYIAVLLYLSVLTLLPHSPSLGGRAAKA